MFVRDFVWKHYENAFLCIFIFFISQSLPKFRIRQLKDYKQSFWLLKNKHFYVKSLLLRK